MQIYIIHNACHIITKNNAQRNLNLFILYNDTFYNHVRGLVLGENQKGKKNNPIINLGNLFYSHRDATFLTFLDALSISRGNKLRIIVFSGSVRPRVLLISKITVKIYILIQNAHFHFI